MKKLFILIAAVAFAVPASVFAQDSKVTKEEDKNTITYVEETETPNGRIVTTTVLQKNSVFTNGFWHNWELDLGLGTELYYGENDWKVKNKFEMFTFPAIDAYLTKWASPVFGVGLGVTGGSFKGLYQMTPGTANHGNEFMSAYARFQTKDAYKDADPKYADESLAYQKGSFVNVYALAHADLGNLFFGFNPSRFFTIDAYAGGGAAFGFTEDGLLPAPTFNAGLINKFRLNDQLSIMLNIRGALVGDDFDGESSAHEPTKNHWLKNTKMDGIFGGTLGLAWKIGKEYSKWQLAERTSVYQYEKDVEKIVETKIEYVDRPVYISKVPEVWFHINFIVDRWDLSKKELININAVADLIKSTPDVKYLVCGYADKQTATPPHNLMLSENRSKAVYDALIDFGVKPEQLVRDYKGGVDYMFYNMKELSRCVMITPIHEATE